MSSSLAKAFFQATAQVLGHDDLSQLPPKRGPNGNMSYVIDRHGKHVRPRFDEITRRIEELCGNPYYGPPLADIDAPLVTMEVIPRFHSGMTTRELDAIVVSLCTAYGTHAPDYFKLAARICVSDLHKRSPASMAEILAQLKEAAPERFRISDEFCAIVERRSAQIDARLRFSRDFHFKFFGFQTLAFSYLQRSGDKITESTLLDDQVMERPQHGYMREAIGLFVCQPGGGGHLAPDDELDARLEKAFRYYELLSMQKVSHATPTKLNIGTKNQQLSSCFLTATGDDLPTLYDTLKDTALISKWSGGVSIWLSNVRAEGALIRKTNGRGSGIKRYIRVVNESKKYIDQGGNRDGAFVVYLEPWHDDIMTFLDLPRMEGVVLNAPDLKYGLMVTSSFLRAVHADADWHTMCPDESPGLFQLWGPAFEAKYNEHVAAGRYRRKIKARAIWEKMWDTVRQRGVPYLVHKDRINSLSNIQNVGTICSSNLCVGEDTYILTIEGQKRISEIVGEETDVWNGQEWSTVQITKTGSDSPLVRVELSNGAYVDCTPYHKFYDKHGNEIRAADLKEGTPLEKAKDWPVLDGGDSFPYAYTHGLYCAEGSFVVRGDDKMPHRCTEKALDGGVCARHVNKAPWPTYIVGNRCRARTGVPILQLYGEKKKLLAFIECEPESKVNETPKRIKVTLPGDIRDKFEVPMNADLDSRLRWFEGYCDGDGTIAKNKDCYGLHCSSVSLEFLREIRLMLQTMGIDPKIGLMNPARKTKFGDKVYNCLPCYRLLVSAWDLSKLIRLGFAPKRLDLSGAGAPNRDARQFTTVVGVEPLEETYDTYCFNEPIRHRGVFNGILTGQCCEITLPSWSDFDAEKFGAEPGKGEYGVCNLAALCLESFLVERKDGGAPGLDWRGPAGIIESAAFGIEALDNVIEINENPTEEGRRSNKRHRPVGLGEMGLADVFARKKLIFGEPRARALDRAISAAIYYGAMRRSIELGRERGSYESFKYKGGCPASKGYLQPDLWVQQGFLDAGWEQEVERETEGAVTPAMWEALREGLRAGYLRNVFVTAYPPTATTANIIGQNECFEPFTANIYPRYTQAGEFIMVNTHLMNELIETSQWSEQMRRDIIKAGGSIQGIEGLPADLKRRFRTAREMDQRLITLHAAARAPFICQTMSLNYYYTAPTVKDLSTIAMLSDKLGLKTIWYYVHSKPAAGSQKTSVQDPDDEDSDEEDDGGDDTELLDDGETPAFSEAPAVCSRDNKDCAACVL